MPTAPAPTLSLAQAVDTFVHGFAAVRSRTHPYLPERRGPLWVIRDAPRPNPADERRREFVALDVEPAEVARAVRAEARSGARVRCVVCHVHAGRARDPALESAYKAAGFRHLLHEPVFARPLPPVPRAAAPVPTRRVTDVSLARRIAKAARSRQIVEADLAGDAAAHRLFAAVDGDEVIGWVSSIKVGGAAWVSNLFVRPAHRRRGVGGGLMRVMLRDDARRAVRHSVLTASQAGAGLYPTLGYARIGTLQIFTPAKR